MVSWFLQCTIFKKFARSKPCGATKWISLFLGLLGNLYLPELKAFASIVGIAMALAHQCQSKVHEIFMGRAKCRDCPAGYNPLIAKSAENRKGSFQLLGFSFFNNVFTWCTSVFTILKSKQGFSLWAAFVCSSHHIPLTKKRCSSSQQRLTGLKMFEAKQFTLLKTSKSSSNQIDRIKLNKHEQVWVWTCLNRASMHSISLSTQSLKPRTLVKKC